MSDDDPGKARQHLLNFARKHDAAASPPPATAPLDFKRGRRFQGDVLQLHWRAQAWSPDGSQLAFGGWSSKDDTGVLQLWNGQSGHHEGHRSRHLTSGLFGQVISLSWSPDGKYLATAEVTYPDNNRAVHILSPAADSRPVPLPPGVAATRVAWSPDGTLLALGSTGRDGKIALVDPASGAVWRMFDNLAAPLAWQPEGRLLAGVQGTDVLLVDPVGSGEEVRHLAVQTHRPTALGWSRHGNHLAVADGEEIIVYDTDDRTWRWRLPWVTPEGDRGPDGTISAIEWLDGGGYLLEFRPQGGAWRDEWGSTCSTARLWDIEAGRSLYVERLSEAFNRKRLASSGMAVSPDGRRVAVADDHYPPFMLDIKGDLPHFVP